MLPLPSNRARKSQQVLVTCVSESNLTICGESGSRGPGLGLSRSQGLIYMFQFSSKLKIACPQLLKISLYHIRVIAPLLTIMMIMESEVTRETLSTGDVSYILSGKSDRIVGERTKMG